METIKAAEAVRGAPAPLQDTLPGFVSLSDPTQIRRPWRSTARTVFQAAIALAAMWGLVVEALGLPDWAWVSASLVVAGGVTRVMALPAVETFLRTFVPFLSAAPNPTKENP